MAYEVAKNNGKLIISARREDELLRVKNQCLALNSSLTAKDILVLPLDITKIDNHKFCFDLVIKNFGTVSIGLILKEEKYS